MSIRYLPIADVFARADARATDRDAVAALADSITELGLLVPIRVRVVNSKFEIIAGIHRVEACRLLDLSEIPAEVVDDDDIHAELAMIDENLCRAELSPSDRARQTARRKEIYEALHPETRREATLKQGDHLPSRQVGETERFTADTAKATGSSERTVQRDAERGEKVIDEVLDLIRGTKLDTGTYLDQLKKLPPHEQIAKARRDLESGRTPPVGAQVREQQTRSRLANDLDRAWALADQPVRDSFLRRHNLERGAAPALTQDGKAVH